MAAQQLARLGSALIIPLPCRRGRRAEHLSSPLTCSGALTKWRGEKTAFHLREPQFPRPLPFPSKFDFLCVCVWVRVQAQKIFQTSAKSTPPFYQRWIREALRSPTLS